MSKPCIEPLGKAFSELARAYAGEFTDRLNHLPINRYHYALLLIDAYKSELSQNTLADELYIDKTSVVRMLDYLEAEDCIIRRQNPSDRRAHILELTPKALAMIPEIRQAISDTNARFNQAATTIGMENFESGISQLMRQFHQQAKTGFQIQFLRNDEN